MADKWLYNASGHPEYYQQGKFLYSASSHKHEYFEDNGWIYTMTGEPAFFIRDWLYTVQGSPAYYYG
jgi:hypothetical protein